MKKSILFFLLTLPFLAKADMGFTENKGQFVNAEGSPDQILFKSTGTGPQIFITNSGLSFIFQQKEKINQPEENSRISWSKIEMELSGASIRKENIVSENPLPGYSNYYYAHCPQGITNVKSWHQVTIKNIYPGIDWVLKADDQKGMAHDFIVHPGADPGLIRLFYNGVKSPVVEDEKGRLVFHSEYGTLYEGNLFVFEENTGKKIRAKFQVKNNTVTTQVKFLLIQPCSRYKNIVIDPPLQWSSPQASSDFDYGYAIAAAKDGSGHSLLTGSTAGTNFPVLNAFQGLLYGFEDMVVLRLDASGNRLWSTYYGGTGLEQGKAIASDNAGNCYVAGNTGSTNFPVLNQTQPNYGSGTSDAAILKFNTQGVRQWATWYGSLQNDYGNGITVDGNGTVYVTGYTNSANFPVLNAVQATNAGGYDAFIIKLNTSCVVQWASFFGGDDDDKGRAIAIDASGSNICFAGSSLSGIFPATSGVFQMTNANAYNSEDAFIVKMDANEAVQFVSFCGGTDADYAQGITIDNSGSIFISGYTSSGDFPLANPGGNAYIDSTLGSIGTQDAFIVQCNSSGTTRIWSTYFGGTAADMAFAIASDPFVGIYICGNTASTDFPVQQPSDNVFYQAVQGDGGTYNDMFIAWFGINDSLRWSTYYGNANGNEAYGISTDAMNNIFVAGVDSNDIAVLKFGPGVPTGITSSIQNSSFSVWPNPVEETLFIQMESAAEEFLFIEIMDAQGRIIRKENQPALAGTNLFRLQTDELPAGIYVLRLNISGSVQTVKFVKR